MGGKGIFFTGLALPDGILLNAWYITIKCRKTPDKAAINDKFRTVMLLIHIMQTKNCIFCAKSYFSSYYKLFLLYWMWVEVNTAVFFFTFCYRVWKR